METKLKTLVIPGGITEIGNYLFYGLKELTSVTFGAGIKSIGENAFEGCSSLTTLVFPDSVETVRFAKDAFKGCSKLSLTSQAALKKLGYTGSF